MKTLAAALVLSLSTCAFSLAAFGAESAPKTGTFVKRDQLPGNLKGGKEAKNTDGIPGCTSGRKVLPASDDIVAAWKTTHDSHPCASAASVLVCRVGKNISVRCE